MEENGSEIEEGAADGEAADDESIDEDEAILNERRGASRPRNNI